MPGLSTERVENKFLNGPEVIDLCCHMLRKALQAEWAFNHGTAHPRLGIELTAKFHFVNASMPKIATTARVLPPLEAAPIRDIPDSQDQGVIALKLEKTVDNPNLERVHAGLPITVMQKVGQKPGEMFPRVEQHSVVYDKTEYPEPDPPKQTDISAETAKEWNVPVALPPDEMPTPLVFEESAHTPIAAQERSKGGKKVKEQRIIHVPHEERFYGEMVSRTELEPPDDQGVNELDAISVEEE